MGGSANPFRETRTFFRPADVLECARRHLAGYEASIEPPMIDGDPGFTLVARSAGVSPLANPGCGS